MSCGTSRTTGLRSVPALNTTAVSTASMPLGPASQNVCMGPPSLGSPLAISLTTSGSRTLTGDLGSASSVPPCLKPPLTGLSSALKVASCFENPRYRRMSGGNPGAVIRRERISYAQNQVVDLELSLQAKLATLVSGIQIRMTLWERKFTVWASCERPGFTSVCMASRSCASARC